MSDKKKFKETGFGKLLLTKIPSAMNVVGDLLPDTGVFGVVKNVISSAQERGEITPEEAAMLEAEADKELRMYEIDQQDRASARLREIEMAKSGKIDWMMGASGIFALLSAIAIVYVVLFMDLGSDKELFYFVAGAAFGWAGQVMTYYFGSSKGSKDKSNKMDELLNKR